MFVIIITNRMFDDPNLDNFLFPKRSRGYNFLFRYVQTSFRIVDFRQDMLPSNPHYSVLFVCTANLVRSPMAAGLFAHMLAAEGVSSDWRVESAGTWTHPGYKSPLEVRDVMAERQIDLSGHRSRSVSAELLREFSLILVMEPGHKEALRVEFPEVGARVFLLSEMVGKRAAVGDPVGGTYADYQHTAAELEILLKSGRERLETLAKKP